MKLCTINTVCGQPRNKATHQMHVKRFEFAPLPEDGKLMRSYRGCCEACMVEIERRKAAKDETVNNEIAY